MTIWAFPAINAIALDRRVGEPQNQSGRLEEKS
jgi:hypothetical protein